MCSVFNSIISQTFCLSIIRVDSSNSCLAFPFSCPSSAELACCGLFRNRNLGRGLHSQQWSHVPSTLRDGGISAAQCRRTCSSSTLMRFCFRRSHPFFIAADSGVSVLGHWEGLLQWQGKWQIFRPRLEHAWDGQSIWEFWLGRLDKSVGSVSREGQLRWWRVWRTSLVRNSWRNWGCSVWRRGGWGWTFSLSTTAWEEAVVRRGLVCCPR